ncbi:amino acid/amide ABC transporter membrane protein 1, HAAT family /amino acid/amide ABC transporter membrane protein 2, HAAT family [Arboricoccus pini]|uniref:Amino acid/amide ABC transporter membrane protein 1, HAAT family /amino acid/amide ABC transporter membrane protein 2, HAAT family n=1 Tax=Arboricoccus pini TaxID=1963835 RepID=A0A212R3M8_9PROT|nr:ABC transporter permease [Arboricoccus pini]SNB66600.1 amino acid/amide ABC transporter membrane protein 1, HAAT family /amino acid/amide ABC transporter membrane protein 2, HAAT family [Arboricoccus pini]
MSLLLAQFLAGLASAASLFLVASGLSLIFGVTRVVNFAHGAFYMLGAYLAYSLTTHLTGPLGFWLGILAAALLSGIIGGVLEILLLRRIYHAPELFQLLATFGVTLATQDLVILIWGPDDLVGPRAPGLTGALPILGQFLPTYDIFLIVIGPLVLCLLWLLLHRTRFGILLRAATQDREMVGALGVNQKWLFTSVFALGVFLAALGGALQLPRTAVTHGMDLSVIVEVFVVVVIGGLGSVPGAFLAAVLVAELNAFGILIYPAISLVLVFLVMAIVLVVRPYGLLGRREGAARAPLGALLRPWRPLHWVGSLGVAVVLALATLLPFGLGRYGLGVATEILIAILFAGSLQFLMSVGGRASFGHAAYFGLGAYGAALAVKWLGAPMELALLAGPALAILGAALFGWFCVRLSGVYFAMLTLAFAQIVWSIAFQWVTVTGGDNGMLGIWPPRWAARAPTFYWMTLLLTAAVVLGLRHLTFSPFGYALRAAWDSELRAEAQGLRPKRLQWLAFTIAGAVAGLAGALFAFFKGSVFPDAIGIGQSIDGLVMVLLGGVGTVSGAVIGAIAYKAGSIWLLSQTDYSRLVLGLLIVFLVVLFPKGIAGSLQAAWLTIRTRRPKTGPGA